MDPFTIFLVIAGPLVGLAIVVHEVRTWRKPGPRKLPNVNDSAVVNEARYRNGLNSGGSMGGEIGGGLGGGN
jgi:hypothetical protein